MNISFGKTSRHWLPIDPTLPAAAGGAIHRVAESRGRFLEDVPLLSLPQVSEANEAELAPAPHLWRTRGVFTPWS